MTAETDPDADRATGEPTDDETRYCRACGERVAPDADVCANCGVATDVTNVESTTAYCRDCGAEIKSAAEICPHCGVRQRGRPRTTGSSLESDLERFVKDNRGIVAALASVVFPGAGQIINGEIVKGLVVMGALFLSGFLVIFGIGLLLVPLVFVYAVYDAFTTGRDLSQQREREREQSD